MGWTAPRFDNPVQIVVNVLDIALFVGCVVDIVRRPAGQGRAIGHSRSLWVVVLFIGGGLNIRGASISVGPLLYLFTALPLLERARKRGVGTAAGMSNGTPQPDDA